MGGAQGCRYGAGGYAESLSDGAIVHVGVVAEKHDLALAFWKRSNPRPQRLLCKIVWTVNWLLCLSELF